MRSLMGNRVRTLVSLAGVILSTALVCAVLTAVTSLDHGLLQRARETEGTWYVWSGAASNAAVYDLVRDERVSAVATSHELGSALLDQEATDRLGVNRLAVIELPRGLKGTKQEAEALVKVPELAEGRLPETADEIVLPIRLKGMTLSAGEQPGVTEAYSEVEMDAQTGEIISSESVGEVRIDGLSGLASDGPLDLGTTVTLDLGTLAAGDTGPTNATDWRLPDEGDWSWVQEGQPERHTYTVVGFRLPQNDYLGSNLAASGSATIALTAPGGSDVLAGLPTSQSVWACCDGYTSLEELEMGMEVMEHPDVTPATHLVLPDYNIHWNLVRYAGIVEERSLFEGVWAIAKVLVAVIVVTSVSLIFTSFALSVGERTRQFGLLASQGASARQLRGMVLSEALLIGVVGIPLGIGAGLVGVGVALRAIDPVLSELTGTTGVLELYASPEILLLVAVLALVVLLVSAWVPARRAGRVSAVEAIRQTRDVRIGTSARREIERASRHDALPSSAASLPSTLARMAGVPGFVAHRNLSRSTSRGRVVALSLGVSFALFVTSGVITQYLRPFETFAVSEGASVRSDSFARIYAGLTMDAAELAETLDMAARATDELEGAEVIETELQGSLPVVIPASLITDDLRDAMEKDDEVAREMGFPEEGLYAAQIADSGAYVGDASISFVDEETWDRLAQEAGIDPAADDTVLALGAFQGMMQDDTTQPLRIVDTFAATGDITVVNTGGPAIDVPDDDTLQRLGAGEVPEGSWTLHLGGTTTEYTDVMAFDDATVMYPYLIAPARLLDTHPTLEASTGVLSIRTDGTSAISEDINDAITSLAGDFTLSVYDVTGQMRQVRAVLWTIRLFTLLFSAITMLIAIANVFNTLSNSISLRVREFAVLRSVGMSPSAFSRMIACECASYAVRGLALGLVLVALVDVGIWQGFGLSFEGIPLMVPWVHLGVGALGVVVVTVFSVIFALRRSGATSIVEALRSEVV